MRGIIFTENNFLLTIDGIKKQTRRIMKPQPEYFRLVGTSLTNCMNTPFGDKGIITPRYKVGETVYLKEPYYEWDEWDHEDGQFSYRFNNPEKIVPFWENKLFMPKSAARYFIKITAVRAERLQDISDEDCIKEGVLEEFPEAYGMDSNLKSYWRCPDGMSMEWFETPQQAYAFLFDTINGKGTWNLNPFVWVIDYSLIEN